MSCANAMTVTALTRTSTGTRSVAGTDCGSVSGSGSGSGSGIDISSGSANATSTRPASPCAHAARPSFTRRRTRQDDYAPHTLAADVARLLDPAYASFAPSSTSHFSTRTEDSAYIANTRADINTDTSLHPDGLGYGYIAPGAYAPSYTRGHHRSRSVPTHAPVQAYVDSAGELHDPDFRLFPDYAALRARVCARARRRHTVSGRLQARRSVVSRAQDDDEDEDDEGEEEDSGDVSDAIDEDGLARRLRARGHARRHSPSLARPRPGHRRRASVRSASSVFSAASYMVQDAAPASATSAPTVLVQGRDAFYAGGVEEQTAAAGGEGEFGARVAGGDVREACSTSSSTSRSRWGFLRRVVCSPSLESRESLSRAASGRESRASQLGRSRRSSGSGSDTRTGTGSRSLLQRFLRSGSASTATSAYFSTSETCASSAGEEEQGKSDAQVVVQEYYGSLEDAGAVYRGVTTAALPDSRADCEDEDEVEEVTEVRREHVLRRRIRALNLRVRTRIWRVKKRLLKYSSSAKASEVPSFPTIQVLAV